MGEARPPIRVLFLCTENSARSQIAEAVLRRRGGSRFEVASAGTHPARRVHPLAIDIIEALAPDASRHRPKALHEVADSDWDIVITLCDRVREACPRVAGRAAIADWGIPDPVATEGSADAQRRAFRATAAMIARRVDLLLALPMDKLETIALEQQLRSIAETEGPERLESR